MIGPPAKDFRSLAAMSLESSRNKEEQGVLQEALHNLDMALGDLIAAAVRESGSIEALQATLREMSFLRFLREHRPLEDRLVRERPELAKWAVGMPSQHSLVAFAHVAWLLDEWQLGDDMARHAWELRAMPRYNSAPFYLEYARGLTALVDGSPYEPAQLKAKQLDRPLVSVLALIADLANGRDPHVSADLARKDFDARQRDKRRIDWHGMDGDGYNPTRVPFRLVSLQHWAQVRRGVEF